MDFFEKLYRISGCKKVYLLVLAEVNQIFEVKNKRELQDRSTTKQNLTKH